MLSAASWDGRVVKVKCLVWLGTDPNTIAPGRGGALHGAAAVGNTEIVRFLLDHGANPNLKEKFDVTPLWWARNRQHADVERVLIEHGADPDTSNINPP